MTDTRSDIRIDARFLFGGENFANSSTTDLKRALLFDAIAVLALFLGLAGAALGQSQEPPKDEKKPQQQSSEQSTPASLASGPQKQDPAVVGKAAARKPKKVYGEDDLKNLSGGVSVVGDGKAGSDRSSQDKAAISSGGDQNNEKEWRARAQQIHQQMDATDDQIKNLKEDIKKNGASGFDAQSGLRQGVVYLDDKNARLQKLENKKKSLEQALDQLQEEARKAGADSAWVR
jgi:hypothetical protein